MRLRLRVRQSLTLSGAAPRPPDEDINGDQDSIEIYAKLNSPNDLTRDQAVRRAVRYFGEREGVSVFQARLFQILMDDPSDWVRYRAIQELGAFVKGEGRRNLLRAADDGYPMVRRQLCYQLKTEDLAEWPAETLAALIYLTGDPDDSVQQSVAEAAQESLLTLALEFGGVLPATPDLAERILDRWHDRVWRPDLADRLRNSLEYREQELEYGDAQVVNARLLTTLIEDVTRLALERRASQLETASARKPRSPGPL